MMKAALPLILTFCLLPFTFGLLSSDHRAVADDAVFGDDDDAVAYVPASVGRDLVWEVFVVDEPDARAYPRVLVHDGVSYDRALADAYARGAAPRVGLHVLNSLIVV